MRDHRDILEAFARVRDAGDLAVLASVVHTEGSTYRRPGARALILPADEGAEVVGLVSGGCLESDLIARARSVRDSGEAARVHYDSRSDDDLVFGLGLGCRGVVDVLLEPVGVDQPGPLPFLENCFRNRSAGSLATVTRSDDPSQPLGTFWAFDAQGALAAGSDDPPPPALLAALPDVSLDGRPVHVQCDGRTVHVQCDGVEISCSGVSRRTRLVLVGAGPDAPPLLDLAHAQGWEVVVVDPRQAYARAARLPGADRILVAEPGPHAEIEFDSDTVAMIMSHHYARDRDALRWLLSTPVPYVGLLGPAARAGELLDDLRTGGCAFEPEDLARLHAPAGLDIGADGPHAIAVSIVAEIEAVLAGHPGGPLRDRKAPIHEPEA